MVTGELDFLLWDDWSFIGFPFPLNNCETFQIFLLTICGYRRLFVERVVMKEMPMFMAFPIMKMDLPLVHCLQPFVVVDRH